MTLKNRRKTNFNYFFRFLSVAVNASQFSSRNFCPASFELLTVFVGIKKWESFSRIYSDSNRCVISYCPRIYSCETIRWKHFYLIIFSWRFRLCGTKQNYIKINLFDGNFKIVEWFRRCQSWYWVLVSSLCLQFFRWHDPHANFFVLLVEYAILLDNVMSWNFSLIKRCQQRKSHA
jgi:hypothetical protein